MTKNTSHSILLWGSVLKDEVSFSIAQSVKNGEAHFAFGDEQPFRKSKEGHGTPYALAINAYSSVKNPALLFNLWYLASTRVADTGSKVVLKHVDDFTAREENALKVLSPGTSAVIFVINAMKHTIDDSGWLDKKRDEWELTKTSFRMLKAVMGGTLVTKVPLVVLLVGPGRPETYPPFLTSIPSSDAEKVTRQDVIAFLQAEGSWSDDGNDKLVIMESERRGEGMISDAGKVLLTCAKLLVGSEPVL